MASTLRLATRPGKICTSRGRSVGAVKVFAYQFDVTVRPYTLRPGDTFNSIADKRGLSVEQIIVMNPELNPDKVASGDTILLPSGKLSSRDKEILDGMGPRYRIYPVRTGETLGDILGKRKISMEEFQELNPGVDPEKLKDNQLLKLPSNKFTVREREMLLGSGILPPEFFGAATNPFTWGIGALLMVCGFVLAWQRFYREEDDDDELEQTPTKATS